MYSCITIIEGEMTKDGIVAIWTRYSSYDFDDFHDLFLNLTSIRIG
jgi:hypothetical protein